MTELTSPHDNSVAGRTPSILCDEDTNLVHKQVWVDVNGLVYHSTSTRLFTINSVGCLLHLLGCGLVLIQSEQL